MQTSASAAPSVPSVVVDQQWLQSHLSQPDLILVDVRSPERYTAGHVTGAINLPVKLVLDPAPDHSRHIAPIDKIQSAFSNAGIDMSHAVVIYDQGEDYREAARVFYVLESHGHPAVAVLNKGYLGWTAAGGAVSTQETARPKTQFIANMQPQRMATKLTVARAMNDPHTIILDARSDDEYAGRKSDAPRAGHIPSAMNVDVRQTIVSGPGVCQLKYSDELVKVYQSLPKDRHVIAYCNTGTRASISYLALRQLGRDVAVYDGAWMEWAGDPSLPIESAAPPTTATAAGQ